MGTIKRLNDAQQRLQDAENAMPGAYDDQYAARDLTLPRQTAATRTH